MRTGTIISLILLALVVAGGILNAQATDAVSQRYVAAAEELRSAGNEDLYVVTCFSDRDKLLCRVEKEA